MIHWVPEHIGVAGNERANEVVLETVEKSGRRRCLEQFTSLAYVGRKITEHKWKENKH